ncbi:NAD(P)/FAD-dependent oxidoreductase [bacterium]|nr:NAD(P)/FAD-dependent oxidoreductase [bacterium]RQV93650.1 MAG: NAD(P)/FAD-dependent oxidoreductase [bacterium]
MNQKTAIIIGAGPAGLTAAYELTFKTDITPIVLEMTGDLGGIAKTVHYKGNRIDIGGHRYFSKSEKINQWWENIMPLQGAPAIDDILLARNVPFSTKQNAPDPEKTDRVMLFRNRISHIYFQNKFFNYPISLNFKTLFNLGFWKTTKIGYDYVRTRLSRKTHIKTLEDLFIHRFGKELYRIFFKGYTEKIWGVPCRSIQPEWGLQRIKNLSVSKTILHALKNNFLALFSITPKSIETSLIKRFLYPKLGSGQMWEEAAKCILERGGYIHLNQKVTNLYSVDKKITHVEVVNPISSKKRIYKGTYFFSTMPIRELISSLDADVPKTVLTAAKGLLYRDFIIVGLLLKKLKLKNTTNIKTLNHIPPDHWIYIQDESMKMGRLQIINNWSPYLIQNRDTVWIGAEYFCSEDEAVWNMTPDQMKYHAIQELSRMNMIDAQDILDGIVIKMPKAYPSYFGTYHQLNKIIDYVDTFENLFLIGRNGMHKYNNMDHSMLTAITAVENIRKGIKTKDNIWAVNIEKELHEK